MSEVMIMFGDIFLRTVLSAVILFFLAKLMGKTRLIAETGVG